MTFTGLWKDCITWEDTKLRTDTVKVTYIRVVIIICYFCDISANESNEVAKFVLGKNWQNANNVPVTLIKVAKGTQPRTLTTDPGLSESEFLLLWVDVLHKIIVYSKVQLCTCYKTSAPWTHYKEGVLL